MEGTNLMRHRTKDRRDRLGIERRTSRRYALEGQGPLLQSRFQTPQKGRDIVMGGIVIEDGIENALVPPIVDGREHTIGPLIELISRHVARKRLQCPVQKRAVRSEERRVG